MMVHFFTDRLARVDLVFILRAQMLVLAFDSTCMCPWNGDLGIALDHLSKSQKPVSSALTASE
jgi:hypothetical protein